MQIFRQLNNLPNFKSTVITIGTYDGVHLGHQQIIKRINHIAKKVNGESLLVTFHPHPRLVVNSNYNIKLLSPLDEKFDLLRQYGIDNVVVVPFTREFSQQEPQAYVTDFLVKNFNPHTIVIGYNHRFGKNRAGDLHLMQEIAEKQNFEVEQISKQEIENLSISSTKIRKALQAGDVTTAIQLLGHEYFVRGIVVKGKQLGKKIGFPTANLAIPSSEKLVPDNGVYAVRVKVKEQFFNGMLNIGWRPTVSGKSETVEVHIFDFDADIYGETIQLNFVKLIRREQKFKNLEGLISQLKKDKIAALDILE
ncbi:MAG: bifunctional riboflavin kinase/FAD synthetase [Chitinophagales bacterium]